MIPLLKLLRDFLMNTLRAEIESWCRANGIAIPPGFYRHPASRYVAMDMSQKPSKLVARTWFNLRDLDYYLENVGASASYRALDFTERRELIRSETGRLSRADAF